MKPIKIKIIPERVIVEPKRVRPLPEQDEHWTYIAGAIALSADAYHYIDQEFEGYAMHTPAAGVGGCYIPPPDVAAHNNLAKQSLSSEAHYVLDLILNTPAEVLSMRSKT